MDYTKYNELSDLISKRQQIKISINEVKSFICEENHYNKTYIRNADGDGMCINQLVKSLNLEEVAKHLETFKTLLISDLDKKIDQVNKEISKFEINKI